MRDTETYKQDKFGLKTLDEADKLYLRTMPNKNHMGYDNVFFFDEMFPFLYEKVWPTKYTFGNVCDGGKFSGKCGRSCNAEDCKWSWEAD